MPFSPCCHLVSSGQAARQFRIPENPVTLSFVLRPNALESEPHKAGIKITTYCARHKGEKILGPLGQPTLTAHTIDRIFTRPRRPGRSSVSRIMNDMINLVHDGPPCVERRARFFVAHDAREVCEINLHNKGGRLVACITFPPAFNHSTEDHIGATARVFQHYQVLTGLSGVEQGARRRRAVDGLRLAEV